jgi:hypothetical protein
MKCLPEHELHTEECIKGTRRCDSTRQRREKGMKARFECPGNPEYGIVHVERKLHTAQFSPTISQEWTKELEDLRDRVQKVVGVKQVEGIENHSVVVTVGYANDPILTLERVLDAVCGWLGVERASVEKLPTVYPWQKQEVLREWWERR